jgi:type II secretory pathway pseudopilin PulG
VLEARRPPADTRYVLARLRSERGFGLLELLVAMVILNVGLLAVVATLQSGAVSLRRASRTSTAAAMADAQLERYRALRFEDIALDGSLVAAADATYTGDAALGTIVTRDCGVAPPLECLPTQGPVTGPDGGSYRLDTYVVTVSDRLRRVTVVVRGPAAGEPALARVASTFDASAG